MDAPSSIQIQHQLLEVVDHLDGLVSYEGHLDCKVQFLRYPLENCELGTLLTKRKWQRQGKGPTRKVPKTAKSNNINTLRSRIHRLNIKMNEAKSSRKREELKKEMDDLKEQLKAMRKKHKK